MSIREKLKSREANVLTHDLLGEAVEIRKLTFKQRSDYLAFSNSLNDDGEAKSLNWNALTERYAKLFAMCVYDPETKQPVFEDGNEEHRAILFALDPEPVDELALACLDFNGLGKKEAKTEGKDVSSDAAPSS